MKKKLTVLVALTCAFGLTACGGGSQQAATTETPKTESVTESVESVADVSLADVSVADAIDTADLLDYAGYAAAEIDDPVVVETYVQAKQGWWEGAASLYTQDKDGGYFIFNMAMTEEEYEKLVPGTKILVAGYKAEWSGEVEITDARYEIVEGDTFIAEPVDVTDLFGTDELINYQNQYISVKDMQVVATKDADGNDAAYIYNWDGSGKDGDDLYFNVSKGGEGDPVYTFTVESYLTGAGTDVYEAVKALEIGQTIDMEGYLYWYEGANPHIVSVTVK